MKKKKMSGRMSESVFKLVVDVCAKGRDNNGDEYGKHKLLQSGELFRELEYGVKKINKRHHYQIKIKYS